MVIADSSEGSAAAPQTSSLQPSNNPSTPVTPPGRRPLANLLLAALATLPVVATLWLIVRFGRPQPYWDEWQWVGLLIKQATTGLTFSDLYAQHNESRMVFPRLAMLAWTAVIGQWDVRPGMVLSWLLTIVSALLIRSLSVRTLNLSAAASWALLLPVNCLLFGWFQSKTWLCGFQFVQIIPFTTLLLCAWILTTNLHARATIALLSILVVFTVWSFASGVLMWFALFPALWIARDQQLLREKWLIALWWALAAIVTVAYFHQYVPAGGPEKPLEFALKNPGTVVAYCLVFLGTPLARPGQPFALLFPVIYVTGGAILLAYLAALLFTVAHWKDRALRTAAAPWLTLGGFVVLSTAIAAFNRAGFGVMQASSVRYATPAIYLPVALIYLVPLVVQRMRTGPTLQSARPSLPTSLTAALSTALATLAIVTSVSNYDQACARVRVFSAACAALQFSASINADKILAEHMNNNLDELHRFSKQATELGIFKPGVLRDSNIMPLALDPKGDLDATVDALALTSTHAVASGRAVLLNRDRGADAIVVCGQRSLDDDPRVLAVFGEFTVDQPSIDYAYLPSSWSRWNVRIRRQDIPSNITRLTFWAFDADAGSLYPLPRALDLPASNPSN